MQLIHGDCLEKLKELESNSVDSLVTDPPAGIGFMGKDWDKDKGSRQEWVSWLESIMSECLRVMKPGAHGVVWALPRTSHWTAWAIENAGFEIRDSIHHVFGSGFPKSLNVSKAIDKMHGAEREVLKTIKKTPSAAKVHEGWERPWAKDKTTMDITAPSTPGAIKWDGYGTALKPAHEIWWLIRKPLSEKTVAKNVLEHGTGALNIDACRVEVSPNDPNHRKETGENGGADSFFGVGNKTRPATLTQGRFPANQIFSHSKYCTHDQCDIECAIERLDEQSGISKSTGGKGGDSKSFKLTNGSRRNSANIGGLGDSGGASRFFFEASDTFYYSAKESKRGRGEGNNHPTVKAQRLMRYLCKLVTPQNGVVLDPFMGSGSTGVAAKSEGFSFIGIERESEYFQISSSRIKIILT